MDTTLEEKLIALAIAFFGYYGHEHLMSDIPTRENAFTLGVIMAYQMMNGSGDPDEIRRFHKVMEQNKHLTQQP